MPTPASLQKTLARTTQLMTDYFTLFVKQQAIVDESLRMAIEYALLSGGKRMRPLLVNLVGEMLGINKQDLIPVGLAVECIHAYSLVHDDLPAMDDDELRRGNPTCHVKFGEATAILAGDALQSMAFQILASAKLSPHATLKQHTLIQVLSYAAGPAGMVGGQSIDLSATNTSISLAQLTQLHALKTGALLKVCVLLPCLLSIDITKEEEATLLSFAEHIGLAFQIQDDILDVTADTQTLGKPQGSDQAANKSTFVSLLGLKKAKQELNKQHDLAIQALHSLAYNTEKLEAFTDFMVTRTF
ncbi:MAG: farnesyl diphosphate synthase [Patiriisocius sp.]|jgi:farnesyl diphosphate synthase